MSRPPRSQSSMPQFGRSVAAPQPRTGFLSFNSRLPHLHIAADDDEFDEETLQQWRDEGFDVTYHALTGSEASFMELFRSLSFGCRLGEHYAIIAYGRAASLALRAHVKPQPHLSALVAYYPDMLPAPTALYPSQLGLVVHLAGSQKQVTGASWKSYWYEGTREGFAEGDLPEFEPVAAGLSWSRTLACVRKGLSLGLELEMEQLRENQVTAQFKDHDAEAAMALMVEEPYVNFAPTLTGGVGRKQLNRFYREFFTSAMPQSLKTRLISRTTGIDRVIDEMHVSFRHSKEIPWLLPGVPPTNKDVEIVLVSVVAVRGGKLEHEHVYWDQASVLVQIGLLDPNLVPDNMKARGLQRLPVVGREAARKLLDEGAVPNNKLIPKWNSAPKKLATRTKGKAPVRNGSYAAPVDTNAKTQANSDHATAVQADGAKKTGNQANGAQKNAAHKHGQHKDGAHKNGVHKNGVYANGVQVGA